MQVFILSSKMPDANKWLNDPKFKQFDNFLFKQLLLMKNNKTLMEVMEDKIYDIIKEYPITVSAIPEITKNAKRHIAPENNGCSLMTWQSAISTCRKDERIVILYGDILFSNEALKKIFDIKNDFTFFGYPRDGEIYGASFINTNEFFNIITYALSTGSYDWNLYRIASNTEDKKNNDCPSDRFITVKDNDTYEFDYKSQYDKYLKEDNKI